MSKTPVWIAFVARLEKTASTLGISVNTDLKGYVQYTSPVNGHKLYVQKIASDLPRIDTTLEIGDLDIGIPLDEPNGRIKAHVVPDPEVVNEVFKTFFTDPNIPLPAPKRGGRTRGADLDALLSADRAARAPQVRKPEPQPEAEEPAAQE